MYSHINKKTSYIRAMKRLDEIAASKSIAPAEAAMKVIVDNIEEVKAYVIRNGQRPESHPISLAAQACLIHENKIWDKVKAGQPDYNTAEEAVLAEEQAAEDANQYSPFSGSILGAIFKSGREALDKINEKRIAAGKKPLLAGEKGQKLLNKVQAHADIEKAPKENPNSKLNQSEIGIFFNSLIENYKREEVKETIKRLLPFIILILVGVFLLGRKFK